MNNTEDHAPSLDRCAECISRIAKLPTENWVEKRLIVFQDAASILECEKAYHELQGAFLQYIVRMAEMRAKLACRELVFLEDDIQDLIKVGNQTLRWACEDWVEGETFVLSTAVSICEEMTERGGQSATPERSLLGHHLEATFLLKAGRGPLSDLPLS